MKTPCPATLFALPLLLALTGPAHAATPAGAEGDDPPWKVEDPHGDVHSVEIDVREGTWMSVTVHGDRIVFDLLGDLWSIPMAGGEATRLTAGAAWDAEPRFSPDGSRIAYVSDAGGNEQIWVMDADGSHRRQLTSEDEARLTDPVWDPAGPWIVARRRTVDTRSIGVTELWQYHLEGGKGFALTRLDEHPHAGEATTDGRFVWFSSRHGRFEYGGDPVAGLWDVVRLDRRNGSKLKVVTGAGSASRPTLSPDGRTLLFVSRDRDKTLLEALDLATGRRRVVADWLDHDQLEGFALHGTYPRMSFAQGGTLVLWAKGKLWRVRLDGGRSEIPFRARGEFTFHDVPRWPASLPDEVVARVIRWPTWGPDGSVAFSAFGALWVRRPDGAVVRVSPGTGYSPAWSPDGRHLAWTSWRDDEGGRLHVTRNDRSLATETLPVQGQLVNPAWDEEGRRIAVLRGIGGGASPDLGEESAFEVVLLTRDRKTWRSDVVTTTANRGSAQRSPRLSLHGERIWFMEDRATEPRKPDDQVLVSLALDGTDKRSHLVFAGAEEVVPSPDFTRVAYKLQHRAWLTALPAWGGGEVRVDGGTLPVTPLAKVVGDWLGWTPDGGEVTWAEGNVLKRRAIQGVGTPRPRDFDAPAPEEGKEEKPEDLLPDLPGADEAGVVAVALKVALPRARPERVLALTHARVVTLRGDEVLEDATVLVEGDRIAAVGRDVELPAGAEVIDCSGKTVIPGLVDVHAHLHYASGDVLPEREWRYLTQLDFGVTTVHDPSASTDAVFTQAERVEAGLMEGPRVLSTGFVLYGALSHIGAPTPDPEAALAHVRRLKALGATSVKVYQQGQRERRQWYAQACRAERILCVTEGGGDLFQDLGMVADGFHAVEHSLSISPVYDDVKRFLAASRDPGKDGRPGGLGTAWTPTLLVSYGGLPGEHWFFQHADPIDDARLLKHHPRRELDRRAWRPGVQAHDGDWNHQQAARDAADVARRGALVTLGAHGQLQGLGVHWELWALAGPGAMTPLEALRAATVQGARYLGLDGLLGTVEAGKLADLVVLEADPLADIRNSTRIDFVVQNGAVHR